MKFLFMVSVGLLSMNVNAKTVVVLGDSISAGYGIDVNAGWVSLLEKKLKIQMDIQFDFEAELQKLDEKIKDAQENLGDVEVRDAILEKAVFYEKNNDIEKAMENYQLAITKTIGVGKKLDIVFSMMKILLGKQDLARLTKKIEECKKLLEEGR